MRGLKTTTKILRARVEDRTAQLAAAVKEAQEARLTSEGASQAKSNFLATMSHELRTPLNAIIGYSEMLIEESDEMEPEETVKDLDKIRSAGKHLLNLINDILDLSKIEAGKMDLYLEEFDFEGDNRITSRHHCAQDKGELERAYSKF